MSHDLRSLHAEELLLLRAAGRAPGTIYLVDLALRHFLDFVGNGRVAAVDRQLAARYVENLWSTLGPRSIRREVGCLRAAWNRAQVPNPWAALPVIQVDPVDLRIVSREEERLLRAEASRDLSLWISICLESGARPGEICALRARDVLRDRAAILIQSRTSARTKTRKSRMSVLSVETHATLLLRVARGQAPWGSRRPRKVLASMRRALYRLCAALSIPRVTPQDLRRTVGTRLALEGINPMIAAKILGHSDPSTTMRYYTRVQDADAASAVSRTWTA